MCNQKSNICGKYYYLNVNSDAHTNTDTDTCSHTDIMFNVSLCHIDLSIVCWETYLSVMSGLCL